MMLRSCAPILIVMCCLFSSGINAQKFYNTEVEAKIDIVKSNGLLLVTANANNVSRVNRSLRYTMSVIKRDGTDNPEKEVKEGLFVIEPAQKLKLTNFTLKESNIDDILLFLAIFDNDNLIGKEIIIIEDVIEEIPSVGDGNLLSQALTENDVIGIEGLITEDTKTKAGRDFYRFFTQKCYNANIKWPKDVNIAEDFGLGRSTVIKVTQGRTIVAQFNAQPREDFLKEVVNACIKRLLAHFKNLERVDQQLTSY